MAGQLHFSHGTGQQSGDEAYLPANAQSYSYAHSTWPPAPAPAAFPSTMSSSNGTELRSHAASTAASSDYTVAAAPTSMSQPLLSPTAYDMSHPLLEPMFAAPLTNTSHALNMAPSLQTSLDGPLHTLQYSDVDHQLSPAHLQIRTSMGGNESALQQALEANAMMQNPFNLPMQDLAHQTFSQADALDFSDAYAMPLHTSPTELYMGSAQSHMDMLVSSSINSMDVPAPAYQYSDLTHMIQQNQWANSMLAAGVPLDATFTASALPLASTENAYIGPGSLSSNSDTHSFVMINPSPGRLSLDGFSDMSAAVSPTANHVRADSHSSHLSEPPQSAASTSSMEELFDFSPEPEFLPGLHAPNGLPAVPAREYPFANDTEFEQAPPSPPLPSPQSSVHPSSPAHPVTAAQSPQDPSSISSSPAADSSPKSLRRTSPLVGVSQKIIAKKKTTPAASSKSEKRVGRRRGPLRPEQREQAHEIRKLRACLRCRFLKKVCDKGNPCGGCQPSHARLWQVPCTRIDIKDIGYFFKDWNADYERHVTKAFSIANIKGFGTQERPLYITHGYGFIMPINAREVFVRDESCFGVDWVEQKNSDPAYDFEVITHKLSAGIQGISKSMVSDYVNLHLDQGFEHFIDEYFDGTPFLMELLRSIYKYYLATNQQDVRKGLRLVIAYALTLHITMVNGLNEDEAAVGRIDDRSSRYFGQTCAPVMINFQVKTAMADLWRELMGEVLADLSTLYSAVYAGKKQKSWPTIFMLAALILSVWEMMQFDCHYRVPEEEAVQKFCDEMEHVPVGVVVGLFGAISTKLPGFQEWDAVKHGNVFNNDPAVCDTMTSVRSHIEKHETYLRNRNDAKFCRDDFDSLSNKFLSKLVIRA